MKTNAKPDMHRIDQVGRAISRQLNEHAADLPHDITERLRVARMQALAQRKPEPIRIVVPGAVWRPPCPSLFCCLAWPPFMFFKTSTAPMK